MKSIMNLLTAVFFFSLMFSAHLTAQTLNENSVKITMSGTSTLHEWDMMSTEGDFEGKINKNSITDIKFVVPVESLVSGKSAMDRNTYEALESEKYPNIIFEAESITTLNGNDEVKGKMTIHNVTKEVVIPMAVSHSEGEYILQGFIQLQMRDFNIEPPKFMMGAVKTGEVVSVKFVVSVVKEE